MGKPLAGDVVVIPFPQTNLRTGKRRPALVVVDLPGDDLILCQITSQFRSDPLAIPLTPPDFEHGRLAVDSFIRPGRLFTVEHTLIHYTAGRIRGPKLEEVKSALRRLFS